MNVARIDSKTNIIINLEVCDKEWFDNANSLHNKNSDEPYFVEFVHNNNFENMDDPLWERGRPEIGEKYNPLTKKFQTSHRTEWSDK